MFSNWISPALLLEITRAQIICLFLSSVDTAFGDEQIKEYHDDTRTVRERAQKFAGLLKKGAHFVVYTGAGISTAAKVRKRSK
jgi:hypothetical protein